MHLTNKVTPVICSCQGWGCLNIVIGEDLRSGVVGADWIIVLVNAGSIITLDDEGFVSDIEVEKLEDELLLIFMSGVKDGKKLERLRVSTHMIEEVCILKVERQIIQ